MDLDYYINKVVTHILFPIKLFFRIRRSEKHEFKTYKQGDQHVLEQGDVAIVLGAVLGFQLVPD
jgi:hypothetical protein